MQGKLKPRCSRLLRVAASRVSRTSLVSSSPSTPSSRIHATKSKCFNINTTDNSASNLMVSRGYKTTRSLLSDSSDSSPATILSVFSEGERRIILEANFEASLPTPREVQHIMIRLLKKGYANLPTDDAKRRADLLASDTQHFLLLNRLLVLYSYWLTPIEAQKVYFLKTVNNQFDTVQLFTEYETYHASKFFSDQPGIAAQPISSIFEIDGIDRRSDFRFMFNVTAKDKQIAVPLALPIILSVKNRLNIENVREALHNLRPVPSQVAEDLETSMFHVLGFFKGVELDAALQEVEMGDGRRVKAFVLATGPELVDFYRKSVLGEAQGLTSVQLTVKQAIALALSPGPDRVEAIAFLTGIEDEKTPHFVAFYIIDLQKSL